MNESNEMDLKDLENVTGGAGKAVPFDKKKKDAFDAAWNKMPETEDISGTKQSIIYDRWEKRGYPLPIEGFIKANL